MCGGAERRRKHSLDKRGRPYPWSVKMPRRRVGLALGLSLCLSCSAIQHGPSYDSTPFGSVAKADFGWATKTRSGVTFTDGLTVLQNSVDKPLTLVDVQFEDGEPGLDLVGAKVAGLDRAIGGYEMLPSFPPKSTPPGVVLGPLSGLQGYVIPPGGAYATKGVELLLGVRRTVAGRASRRALIVTYKVDGKTGKARLKSSLTVCDAAQSAPCAQQFSDK